MVGKGARPQKKKALNDFLHALEAAGASRSRSAVPAEQRGLTSWFLQVSHLDEWWVLSVGSQSAPCLARDGRAAGQQAG